MSDIERIEQRLSAVERAVVDGDVGLAELADLGSLAEDLEGLETRVEEHERRIAELEGSVDAIGGFVGNVASVNEDVEKQADAAIAAVDRLEYRIDELERTIEERDGVETAFLDGPSVDGTASEQPALERTASRDRSRADGAGVGPAQDVAGQPTGSSTATRTDDPFGDGDDPERAAGELLDGDADVESSGTDDAADESDDTGGEGTSGLLAAVRARLS